MRDLGSHGPYCITESHANPPNMPHSRLYGSAVDLEFFNFWPEFFLTKVAGFCSGLATVGAGGGLAGVHSVDILINTRFLAVSRRISWIFRI